MKILLLEGGASSEREVSLSTAGAIGDSLREGGHEVVSFDTAPAGVADAQMLTRLLAAVKAECPDVAFLALHGGAGEDGHLQAALDLIGLPYTGSGMRASAMCMDKAITKELLRRAGVPTPEWIVLDLTVSEGSDPEPWSEQDVLDAGDDVGGVPLVVKPVCGGSTVGISIVREPGALVAAVEEAARWDDRVMLERYVPGRELTVSVIDGEPQPVVEIIPEKGFYDYESKYTAGRSRYEVPAGIPGDLRDRLQAWSADACGMLQCRGGARVDYRLDPDDGAYCLEVNTIPGMTATSLLPMAAGASGMSFADLLTRLCQSARHDGADPPGDR